MPAEIFSFVWQVPIDIWGQSWLYLLSHRNLENPTYYHNFMSQYPASLCAFVQKPLDLRASSQSSTSVLNIKLGNMVVISLQFQNTMCSYFIILPRNLIWWRVKYDLQYFKYGRVIFRNRDGFRTTKAFHSSFPILPSLSASASANVCQLSFSLKSNFLQNEEQQFNQSKMLYFIDYCFQKFIRESHFRFH